MAIYVHMNVPSRAMRMAADVSVLIPDVPLKKDPEKGFDYRRITVTGTKEVKA